MNDSITSITFNGWWKRTLFFSNMSKHNRQLLVFLQIFKTQIWLLLYPLANASTDLGWNRSNCRFCFSFTAGTTIETTSPCLLTACLTCRLLTLSTTNREIIPTLDFFPQCTYEVTDTNSVTWWKSGSESGLLQYRGSLGYRSDMYFSILLSCTDSH